MTSRLALALLAVLALTVPVRTQSAAPADLKTLVANLGSLDYAVRNGAARQLRRAPVSDAVAVLSDAVRSNGDEFVRYRALVLLTSFSERTTTDLARSLIRDRNDRLRQVAFQWFEQHPDPALADTLLSALQSEQAEFVRPALVGAVAALGDNAAVQRALIAETTRGLDFFRSAVIDSLGHHRAVYAFDAIASVTQVDGPLQDDAVLALGRLGDRRGIEVIARIANPSTEVALTANAARCLLGEDCGPHIIALSNAAGAPRATPSVIRSATTGLAAIAANGQEAGIGALVALGARGGAARDEAAVAFATVAIRRPEQILTWLDMSPPEVRASAVAMLKDGFDALEEDFGEEQFFATARAAYWKAPENASTRTVMASIIDALEF